MMKLEELVASIATLRREDLDIWIANAMVRPLARQEAALFEDAECARVRLICTLHYEMDIDHDTLPVVLDLIDQLHETHNRLRALGEAVIAQDEAVRRAILDRVKEREESRAAARPAAQS